MEFQKNISVRGKSKSESLAKARESKLNSGIVNGLGQLKQSRNRGMHHD